MADVAKSKQLTKISAHYFSLLSPLTYHRWILTAQTSTIISQRLNRALWEFRCRRMLSWGLHCSSCQPAIVIRARVALSLIVYRMAVRFSRQMQISSHRIQFHPPWHPAISSTSIRQRVIWPYRSISTLKPHNVIRWLLPQPTWANRRCLQTLRSLSRCRTSTIIYRSSSGMNTLSRFWNRRQLIHR